MTLNKTLTIAGSDASGGAGLEADLKTFQEYNTYGMAAVTVIATMDPDHYWAHDVYTLPTEVLHAQLKTAFSTGIDAVKTGMLSTEEVIKTVGQVLAQAHTPNVVIDPVMVCKGEDEVLNPGNVEAMKQYLLPYALMTTPNLFEAGQLASMKTPKTLEEVKIAAKKIMALGVPHVVIKGCQGSQPHYAADLYYDGQQFILFETPKVDTTYNHGAGCTFAAAITANLANGKTVEEAVIAAKAFAAAGITHGWQLNQYVGPVLHGASSQFGAPAIIKTIV